jgi:hypothetical protein
MRGPSDGGHLADDAIGKRTFPHQAAEIGDLQAELVAIAQVAMIQTINREKEQVRMRLRTQRDRKEEERNQPQKRNLPPI